MNALVTKLNNLHVKLTEISSDDEGDVAALEIEIKQYEYLINTCVAQIVLDLDFGSSELINNVQFFFCRGCLASMCMQAGYMIVHFNTYTPDALIPMTDVDQALWQQEYKRQNDNAAIKG
jgi:hypothetical protein